MDLGTKHVYVVYGLETLCGLSHVHTVCFTVLKIRIVVKCKEQRNFDRVTECNTVCLRKCHCGGLLHSRTTDPTREFNLLHLDPTREFIRKGKNKMITGPHKLD